MKLERTQKNWTAEDQRALLARVLAHPQFARSARLRDFLNYVTEQSIAHPDVPIREPEIAERIFGRSSMQSSDDSIVRVHASQLRKRLEQYFETDGAGEELLIEIPKGNYTPVFKRRQAEPLAPEANGQRHAASARTRPWMAVALGLLSVAVALLVWDDLRVRNRAVAPAGPYQTLFWSELLDSATPCDVVFADSGFGYLRALSRVDISVDQYANRDFGPMLEAVPAQGGLRDWASMLIHRRVSSMADFSIARKITLLAGSRADRIQFMLARDFPAARLNTDNVILIGGRRANPFTEIIESQLNFQFDFEGNPPATLIRNTKPQSGEMPVYRVDESPTQKIPGGYAVVARVPKVNGKGKVVVIAGTESESTEAGGDFILNEALLSQLHHALGVAASDPFPDFEVLMTTTKVGGSSPAARVIGLRRH
jgi:hypothetical protein